ncbi:uncharacterized protein LOC8267419 [Ricinus communis]|uniref:Transcription factor, putative n=1 Tax=Ricinus communis TaxID=3988 RepID=B9RXV8_RICCO|nr:uncharacterized protein LOC8267419 [Ricinus communis]EEF43964.1 transcription factor, putative [Ricinus communis]|eukprot:XP_002518577.1 uncharacterized protein LOC8267419 [Ricinus communis]
MPAFWFSSLKRSLQCKSQSSDVHVPRARNNLSNIHTKKPCGFGCSRSVSNLRDVIHGSKRYTEKPHTSCSPRSLGSSDFLNPITHEVVLSDSTCELRITGFGGNGGGAGGGVSSTFVGTLKPGTPGPGGQELAPHYSRRSHSLSRKMHGDSPVFGTSSKARSSLDVSKSYESSNLVCKKCYEKFKTLDAVDAHHLAKHAVTELIEGDSSRRIVEIICRASWLKSEANFVNIERVLKVHNMQVTIAQFEEYRELVKIKASKLPTRHSRCLADGNELLRFHGTTISCSLGMNGSYSLCTEEKCGVCQILRHGFCRKDIGVFTTSTSGRALESIESSEDSHSSARKALLVCRVIAGRVHKPLGNFQEIAGQSGFDSLAGKVGQHSNIEELYLLNPKALLPCFVVIY